MPTPVKQEILKGKKLKEIKKKLQTPLRKQIQEGTSLRAAKLETPAKSTRRKSTAKTPSTSKTPTRKQVASGKVQSAKKKKPSYADMLKKGIKEKEMLKKMKMKTPLKRQIIRGVKLNPTMQKMQTPLRVGIQQGVKLRAAKKKLQTPLKKEIEGGVSLKQTKKKLQTPLRKEIVAGTKLKSTKNDSPVEVEASKGRQILKAKRHLPKVAIPPIDCQLITFTGEKPEEEVTHYFPLFLLF